MISTNELTDHLVSRAKNLQEFVVEREFADIPMGVVRFGIQHTAGQPARLFVPALNQIEAEDMVGEWFEEGV